MNATKVILLLLAVFGIAINPLSEVNGQTETQAKQIIQSFMDSKGMDIEAGTEEYKTFMRGIVWGEYPELTGNDSDFVKNQEELDYVLDYAWKYSGYKDLYGDYNEPDTEEATSPDQFGEQRLAAINLLTSSGRSNAIAYAYQWSTSGGTSRNPAYPDFGVDDCTNFVSQAMKAGGFIEKGSGDGCKHENTSTEWYVESNPSSMVVLVTFAIGNGQRVGAFHGHFEIILHIRTIMQSLMDGQQVCLLPNIFFPQEM